MRVIQNRVLGLIFPVYLIFRKKFIKSDLISPITTSLYQNRVIFFIWTEPQYGILIQNKTFAKGYKEYFNLLWKQAKK